MLIYDDIVKINNVLASLYGGVNTCPLLEQEAKTLNFNINEYQTTYDLITSKVLKRRRDISKVNDLILLAKNRGYDIIIDKSFIINERKVKFFIVESV